MVYRFSSNLVIGVYVGYDTPKTLGKFETGSKAALPIFKDFIEKALYKEDFDEFKIPENIYLTSLDYHTGNKSAPGEKNSITEALKLQDINNIENNDLISVSDSDKIIKFRQFLLMENFESKLAIVEKSLKNIRGYL